MDSSATQSTSKIKSFSEYNSPTTYRPNAASSVPMQSSSNNQPITLETILSAHVAAPNPHLAALEQALSERNLLSSQNTQLWKLIEKQRAGYNQILKELERVRGERDAYRARVHASGQHATSSKRDKLRDHRSKSNGMSASQDINSAHPGDAFSSPRAEMIRHLSDEPVTPRGSRHELSLSRSQEPMRQQGRASTSGRSESLPTAEGPPRPSVVHPGCPEPSLNQSQTSSSSHSSVSAARSLQVSARKATQQDVNNNLFPPSAAPSSHLTVGNGSREQDQNANVTATEDNTEAAFGPIGQPFRTPITFSHQHSPSLPQGVIFPPQDTPPSFQSAQSSQVNGDSHLTRTKLSRESRISLPAEAKQYIVDMTDSPVPGPRISPVPSDQPLGRNFLAGASNTSVNVATVAPSSSPEHDMPSTRSIQGYDSMQSSEDTGDGEFLDLDDEDGGIGDEEDTSSTGLYPPITGRGNKSRAAAVEDFPLPPSHNPTHVPAAPIVAPSIPDNESSQSLYPQINVSSDMPSGPQITHQSSPPFPMNAAASPSFRALPLLASDLPYTRIQVSHSSIRPNDRGKEVLSFIVGVSPGPGKEGWKVEKLYSDVLGLDSRIRNSVAKGVGKKIASLPEGKLWRDHAPAKVDQRKAALENYLQTLINLPVKNKDEVIAFFTSDIVRDAKQPISQAGYREGYLTKRGKNFGGWKTRYFVLQGPMLEYYESRGGTHLGSIAITGAQIGRQQRTGDKRDSDDEKEYRHAFLIIEAKKGPSGSHSRHVLCAESDKDRDEWVEVLVRYVMGSYSEGLTQSVGPNPVNPSSQNTGTLQPRTSTSSLAPSEHNTPSNSRRTLSRAMSKDDIIFKGTAVPISHLIPDTANAKLFQGPPPIDDIRSSSPAKSLNISPTDRQAAGGYSDGHTARRILERSQHSVPEEPLSTSLPSTSPLEASAGDLVPLNQRANSEMGHYPDLTSHRSRHRHASPEHHRSRDHTSETKARQLSLPTINSSPTRDRPGTPDGGPPNRVESNGKVKISGPLNGVPIPAGYKFGGKETSAENAQPASDRREKAKSRSFWGFGRPTASEKGQHNAMAFPPRAVFGVTLEESLDVARIANLPSIVFRCIEYLEAKKAEQEEGIYRLSGSSAVIKSLKDRFNAEGDVDLIATDEYWDPHAIAGLLKSFLRDLPSSILTRDLHLRFLAVIDFVDAQERIKELSQLIAALPIANYSLLRALTAHLILIVQNANVNKMTMRNVGIVFSPTLGIPAGVFSLMLGEFNRVFNVDADDDDAEDERQDNGADTSLEPPSDFSRRNSRQYTDAAADQLLGLSGRTLSAPEEGQSDDGDDFSVDESGNETTENDATESSHRSSPGPGGPVYQELLHSVAQESLATPTSSKASHVAASRGLNISVSDRGNRHSRMMGLPASPRPTPPSGQPSSQSVPVSPLHTPK